MTQHNKKFSVIPTHIAMIMDGNRRWAKDKGVSDAEGHLAGVENIRSIIEHFVECGVKYLTFFAFSTENWHRSKFEVDVLMKILLRTIDREIKPLHEAGVKLIHIGSKNELQPSIVKKIEEAEHLTRNNNTITVLMAFDYGGKADIVRALKMFVQENDPEDITEESISNYLYTSGIPDPDVIIRTGKEKRLSNFLLWQGAYSELIFLDQYWPDFGKKEIDMILMEYSERDRRFGMDSL